MDFYHQLKVIKARPSEGMITALPYKRDLLKIRTHPTAPHQSTKKSRGRSTHHRYGKSWWGFQGKQCQEFQLAYPSSLINIKSGYSGPSKNRALTRTMKKGTQASGRSPKVGKTIWQIVRVRGPSSWCKVWATQPLPSPQRRTESLHWHSTPRASAWVWEIIMAAS